MPRVKQLHAFCAIILLSSEGQPFLPPIFGIEDDSNDFAKELWISGKAVLKISWCSPFLVNEQR